MATASAKQSVQGRGGMALTAEERRRQVLAGDRERTRAQSMLEPGQQLWSRPQQAAYGPAPPYLPGRQPPRFMIPPPPRFFVPPPAFVRLGRGGNFQQPPPRQMPPMRFQGRPFFRRPFQRGGAPPFDRAAQNRPATATAADNGNEADLAATTRDRSITYAPKLHVKSSFCSSSYSYNEPMEEFELEEPFSDTEEDEQADDVRKKRSTKPMLNLPMPKGRLRCLSGTLPATGYAPVFGGLTMCLGCLEFFDLPDQTKDYVDHLMDKHQIMITHIELIVDLKRYIEHWRNRFGKKKIENIFPKKTPKEGEELFGKVKEYYLMSEDVKEDRKLRETLAMRRLEEVISCQQREREDYTFTAQCLFCRYVARGNRAKIIHHLFMIHHLNLGSPDNLVFLSEYLDYLRQKLDSNECIYCEKISPSKTSLMEHMRKRGHREVNPKNTYYDKFYVINYLELGKKWLDVLAEDFEDTMATFHESDEEEEEEASWNEWEEDNTDITHSMVVCLFCDQAEETLDHLLLHKTTKHGFDLLKALADQRLGFYDRIKFINYIRKMTYAQHCFVCGDDDLRSWEALRHHLQENNHINSALPDRTKWDDEKYLQPVFENDNLLWVLESYLEEKATTAADGAAVNGCAPVAAAALDADSPPAEVIPEELSLEALDAEVAAALAPAASVDD